MTHRILVADDSPTIQKVIRIAFSRMDAEMVGASSYVEALSEATRARPSLLIVDAGLPGTRGPADFAKLKTTSGNVPVVLLVGSYENIDEPAFVAAGLEIIVRKPFDSGDLVKTCSGLLESSAPIAAMPKAPSHANLPPPPVGKNPPVEFDLGEESGAGMFRVTNTDAAARAAPATPTSARDIDLEQAIGHLGIPVIDRAHDTSGGSGADSVPPMPATESGRRGQKAFSDAMPNTSPGGGAAGGQHPATKTHYIPPPSSGGRGPTITPAMPMAAATPSPQASQTSSLRGGVSEVPPEDLARLVREAVEEYCSRHFSGLAREIITAELRRLADDRSRHLVDN